MPKFESRDPFPRYADGALKKSELLAHSREVDAWLGLKVLEIESRLASSGSKQPAPSASGQVQQLWFGLAPDDLLTPYIEIRTALESLELKPGMTVVDLGAAYGRMGFVVARHFQGVKFIGYEYVGERVREGREALKKFGANAELAHVDLTSSSFKMPSADVFFIYDYGTPQAIDKTLHDLRRATRDRDVQIVARGRNCRYLIESRHAWLARANPDAPEGTISIYRSARDMRVEATM